jgi:hypothetical protein
MIDLRTLNYNDFQLTIATKALSSFEGSAPLHVVKAYNALQGEQHVLHSAIVEELIKDLEDDIIYEHLSRLNPNFVNDFWKTSKDDFLIMFRDLSDYVDESNAMDDSIFELLSEHYYDVLISLLEV